jgi:sugar lactone lactonase YvrE
MTAAAVPALASIAPRNLGEIKTRRTGKVETVFKSPGPQPNGLRAAEEGLWIMDQGDNKACLASYSDGKVLREFKTDADRASGITFDGEALWIGSTYNREIELFDATPRRA